MNSFQINISQAEKDSYKNAIWQMHQTFSRNITVINEQANAIDPNDPNYNAFADIRGNVTRTSINTTIPARIKYIEKQDTDAATALLRRGVDSNVQVVMEFGLIRIKVLSIYADLFKATTKVIVDGYDCEVLFTNAEHGILNTDYSTFFVQRQR